LNSTVDGRVDYCSPQRILRGSIIHYGADRKAIGGVFREVLTSIAVNVVEFAVPPDIYCPPAEFIVAPVANAPGPIICRPFEFTMRLSGEAGALSVRPERGGSLTRVTALLNTASTSS
jgi:hypothetical protein